MPARLPACELRAVATMISDYVLLSDIAIHAHHGAIPSENDLGQRFYITVKVELDTREAARTDQVRDTVNYAEVYRIVHQLQGTRGIPASRRNPDWRAFASGEAAVDPAGEPERVVRIAPAPAEAATAPADACRAPEGTAPSPHHLMHCGPFQLIETLAHEAALGILARFAMASAVEVTVRKPSVPIEGILGHAEIGVRRTRADLRDAAARHASTSRHVSLSPGAS